MGWTELEQGDVVTIGGDESKDQRKRVGGLLVRCEYNQGKKKNSAIYSLVQEDGELLKVWGCTTIDNTLTEMHIGKFVGFRFKGIETSAGGNEFKNVKVQVWTGPLDDRLKAWPEVNKFYKDTAPSSLDEEDEDPNS